METKVCNFENFRVKNMTYLLHKPEKIEEGKRYPLVIFLHGAGERGVNEPKLLLRHGPPKLLAAGKPLSAFMLAPQCPPDMIWNQLTQELKHLIDEVVAQNPIDTDRIALTGISMGGYGTWEMGICYPGFFSALAPVCGGGISWRVSVIGKTPVWAIHGEADSVVPAQNSIEMCDRLRASGGSVELTLLRYVDHNSWDFAYERTTLLSWLTDQKRA